MLKTILVLPDGREISSGAGTKNAIVSCSFTECVNSGTELTLGAVCASMIELKLITPDGGLPIAAGDALTVYKDDGTTRQKLGIFIAEKPVRPTANTMTVTAYDRVTLLDRDLTQWLADCQASFPMSLYALAGKVCAACGLELADAQLPNGSYMVPAFTAADITGRQLMKWIGQAAGRFCRATADGKIEFAWYQTAMALSFAGEALTLQAREAAAQADGSAQVAAPDWTLAHDGAGTVILSAAGTSAIVPTGTGRQHYYFQNSLSAADYTVAPVEKVQIQATAEDVGVIWPNDPAKTNTYRITGNLLLTGEDTDALRSIAQTLHAQLSTVSYTPCTVAIPATMDIRAGSVVTVTDPGGNTVTVYVMTKKQTGQRDILECTGAPRRDSTGAVNDRSYQSLSGKVLNLRTDMDGIRAQNKAADDRAAALALTVDGIRSKVEKQTATADGLTKHLSILEQSAQRLSLKFQSVQENGVSKVRTETGYVFDEAGLTISRSGQSVENRLDHTGMYVTRSGTPLLKANDDGVTAIDVQVHNFLCVGDHARFEDYSTGRTACFYVGG